MWGLSFSFPQHGGGGRGLAAEQEEALGSLAMGETGLEWMVLGFCSEASESCRTLQNTASSVKLQNLCLLSAC